MDLSQSCYREEDLRKIVEFLLRHSPEAILTVLLHKYDAARLGEPTSSPLRESEGRIKIMALPLLASCYHTSIWDESLYKAWASIVTGIIGSSSIGNIKTELGRLAERLRCQEVIMIDAGSNLVLAHTTIKYRHHQSASQPRSTINITNLSNTQSESIPSRSYHHHHNAHRMEKISNILKQVRVITRRFNVGLSEVHLELEGKITLELTLVMSDTILLLVGIPEGTSVQFKERYPDFIEQSIKGSKWKKDVVDFRSVLMAILNQGPDADPHMLSFARGDGIKRDNHVLSQVSLSSTRTISSISEKDEIVGEREENAKNPSDYLQSPSAELVQHQ